MIFIVAIKKQGCPACVKFTSLYSEIEVELRKKLDYKYVEVYPGSENWKYVQQHISGFPTIFIVSSQDLNFSNLDYKNLSYYGQRYGEYDMGNGKRNIVHPIQGFPMFDKNEFLKWATSTKTERKISTPHVPVITSSSLKETGICKSKLNIVSKYYSIKKYKK
jgi:glutaredoxin